MSDPFTGEPDPFDVTVTASVVAQGDGGAVLSATLENGTEADGGEVELRVPDSARRAYGLEACVEEFERFLNATMRPEFRLDAALAMGACGPFTIVVAPGLGPRVVAAAMPGSDDLAA
jgi:hypothetical protein